ALPKSSSRKKSGKSDASSESAEAEAAAGQDSAEREQIHARSVTLSSERHGLIAKLDLVEVDGQTATPVDYKRGSPRKLEDGSLAGWDPERVQLCAQALVLRENGYHCDEGVLY